MRTKMPRTRRDAGDSGEDLHTAERRQEAEWTLRAIAGAILTGRLPPDEAFAWARIAAHEAKALVRRAPRWGAR